MEPNNDIGSPVLEAPPPSTSTLQLPITFNPTANHSSTLTNEMQVLPTSAEPISNFNSETTTSTPNMVSNEVSLQTISSEESAYISTLNLSEVNQVLMNNLFNTNNITNNTHTIDPATPDTASEVQEAVSHIPSPQHTNPEYPGRYTIFDQTDAQNNPMGTQLSQVNIATDASVQNNPIDAPLAHGNTATDTGACNNPIVATLAQDNTATDARNNPMVAVLAHCNTATNIDARNNPMWNMVAQLAQHKNTDAQSNHPTLALKDQGSRETGAPTDAGINPMAIANTDTDAGNNPRAIANNPSRNTDTEGSNQYIMTSTTQNNEDTNAPDNPINAPMDQGYGNDSVSTESSITANPDEEDPEDDEENEEFINNFITFKDTASPESTKCTIPNPQLSEYESDSEIKLDTNGTQICMFKYDARPPIGSLFKVNKKHNLVQIKLKPGRVYQTDDNGILHLLKRYKL
jgi:hypothetical protein